MEYFENLKIGTDIAPVGPDVYTVYTPGIVS